MGGIGIPKYQEQMRSSRQMEAKTGLGKIFIAQQAYKIKHFGYTTDLVHMGAVPEGHLIYNIGFSSTASVTLPNKTTISANSGTHNTKVICEGELGAYTKKNVTDKYVPAREKCGYVDKSGQAANDKKVPDIASANSTTKCKSDISYNTFKAIAVADLIHFPNADSVEADTDIWSINQYRQISHHKDGSKKGQNADCSGNI